MKLNRQRGQEHLYFSSVCFSFYIIHPALSLITGLYYGIRYILVALNWDRLRAVQHGNLV